MLARILLADDHIMFREGLKSILGGDGCEIVGETADGQAAVRVAADLKPDLAILDFSMPLLNGIDASREIQKVSSRTKVILLTMHKEDTYVLSALQAGISAYVVKTQAAEDLHQAIRQVLQGGVYLSPGISNKVIQAFFTKKDFPSCPLSPRERQVLQLIAEGHSTKEIAYMLELSVKTVETHRANIMDKLDIHDVASVVRYAIREGLVQP